LAKSNLHKIFYTTKILHQNYGYKIFFIDEIHFNKNYEQSIKNIFDFLKVKIIFTSSVALSLVHSSYDLSRRVELYELHLLSFSEYLNLQGQNVDKLKLQDLISREIDPKWRRFAPFFEKYFKGAALPYSQMGGDVIEAQKNIITTIVEKDIPSVFPVTSEDIFQIKKTIEFTALSSVDGVNYSSLSSNLGITKYKAQQYVHILEKAFILNVSTPHGANVSKEPKILLYLPNRLVYQNLSQALGGLREDFATTMFRSLGMEYSYLKTNKGKKTPDFFLQLEGKKIVIEIGGKTKGHSQFKDLDGFDHKIVFKHSEDLKADDFPLYLLGLFEM
jgi:predicted AAA+ superfamily ATPase